MTNKLDVFLTETRRNYELSVTTINSYDKKLSQVFTMCTAILGILLIGVSLLFDALQKRDLMLNLNNIIVDIWLICLIVTLFTGLSAFILCLQGLKLQEFTVTNPIKLFNKYYQETEDGIKEFLIVQIGDMYNINFILSNRIKDKYKNSLDVLTVTTSLTIILFLITLQLLRSLVIN